MTRKRQQETYLTVRQAYFDGAQNRFREENYLPIILLTETNKF